MTNENHTSGDPEKQEPSGVSFFAAPNFTQAPNILFDLMLPDFTNAELRVALVAIRQTFGYHRRKAEMSLTFIQNASGLSRQGVLTGIEGLTRRNLIRATGETGKRGAKVYELVVQDDLSSNLTSQASRPELVNVVDQSDPGLVNVVDTKNKVVKEKKETAPRERDALFDALAEHVFKLSAEQVTAKHAGGRIAKLRKWLRANYAEVTPEDVEKFALYCGSFIPLDETKFAEKWLRWRSVRISAVSGHQYGDRSPDGRCVWAKVAGVGDAWVAVTE